LGFVLLHTTNGDEMKKKKNIDLHLKTFVIFKYI
jgi:hypothetical protein